MAAARVTIADINENCPTYFDRISTSININNRRPAMDVLVIIVSVIVIALCCLQLEEILYREKCQSSYFWLTFAMGIIMFGISAIIFAYATHRMGIWILNKPNNRTVNQINNNARNGIPVSDLHARGELPPNYNSIFEMNIPPPPYTPSVINTERDNNAHNNDQQV